MVICVALLAGCESFNGPIVKNVSKGLMDVTIVYCNGTTTTLPFVLGQTLRHRGKGNEIDKIVVHQAGQRTEYDRATLHELVKAANSFDDAMILISDSKLEIISIKEAERRRLL